MPKAEAKERPSLERKIYFFRSSIGKDASGSNVPFDAAVPLGAINKLPFDDDGGRYIFDQEGRSALGLTELGSTRGCGFHKFGELACLRVTLRAT